MTNDIGAPGLVDIIELTAEKFDGGRKVDIKSIFSTIDISLSLNTPTIYAKLSLVDYSNFLNNENFTFVGEEFVNISFRRRNTETTFTYKFVVSTMDIEIKSDTADSSMYVLTLLSIDTFVNSATFKSKGYRGSITEIIKSILDTELHTQIEVVEDKFVDTEADMTFAFTEIKPFEKLQILLPRAFKETQNITNLFMFYENRQGYCFEPLDNIIDRANANTTIIKYTHSPVESIDREINLTGILNYSPVGTFDNHRRMFHGLYNSKVIKFDLYNKTAANTQYNSLLDKIENINALNRKDPGISNNFSSTAKSLGSLTYFIPWDSSTNDKTGESLLNNSPYSIILDEHSLDIKTFGTLDYDIGDPINVSILDNASLQDPDKNEDPRYSGKYIIHSITYTIGVEQHGYMMYNNMRIIRNGTLVGSDFYNNQYTLGDIKIPSITYASAPSSQANFRGATGTGE